MLGCGVINSFSNIFIKDDRYASKTSITRFIYYNCDHLLNFWMSSFKDPIGKTLRKIMNRTKMSRIPRRDNKYYYMNNSC